MLLYATIVCCICNHCFFRFARFYLFFSYFLFFLRKPFLWLTLYRNWNFKAFLIIVVTAVKHVNVSFLQ